MELLLQLNSFAPQALISITITPECQRGTSGLSTHLAMLSDNEYAKLTLISHTSCSGDTGGGAIFTYLVHLEMVQTD